MTDDTKIGQLNGWRSLLFQLNLIVLPVALTGVLTLSVWIVVQIFTLRQDHAVLAHEVKSFTSAGPRYTPKDARADGLDLKNDILDEVEKNYPPQWLRDTIDSHARRIEALEQRLTGK